MYMGFAEMKQTKCFYHTKTISFNKVQKYKYLLQINALLTDAITEGTCEVVDGMLESLCISGFLGPSCQTGQCSAVHPCNYSLFVPLTRCQSKSHFSLLSALVTLFKLNS